MVRMSVLRLFFGFDVDGDDARECACNRQGDEVNPTELYVFESVERGKDEEGEEHIHKPCDDAFQNPVLFVFEPDEATKEDGREFDGDVHRHNCLERYA